MPDQLTKPKGILRNRASPALSAQSSETSVTTASTTNSDSSILSQPLEPFDRNAVLENTRANAKIHTIGNAIIQKQKSELADELSHAGVAGGEKTEHLKWNEANLYLNEQEKSATMKITEPKTPFQGAVGDSEYYKPDLDEDEEFNLDGGRLPPSLDDLEDDGLLLGEPEVETDLTIHNDRILVDEKAKAEAEAEAEEQEESEPEETPEERHKRFEQMRKNHYFMKGTVLHKPVEELVDEE